MWWAAPLPSIASWGPNDPDDGCENGFWRLRRPRSGVPAPAVPHHLADVVLGDAVLDLPAAVVLAAVVSRVFCQRDLDERHGDQHAGGAADGRNRDAGGDRRRLCNRQYHWPAATFVAHDANAAARGADRHPRHRHLLRL